MIVFDIPAWQLFQLLASTVFPLVIGLVTTRVTDAARRAVLLAGLSVVSSLATELAAALQTHTAYNLGQALLAALASFLIAVGFHFGLWKATGLDKAAQDALVTASPQELADAEQERALELLAKAGVATIRTAPENAEVLRVADAADRVPGPDHRAVESTGDDYTDTAR
jgi:hypothetical protein